MSADKDIFEADLILGPKRRERIAYIIAAIGVSVGVVGFVGAVSILPLKTVETHVIVVDKTNGQMDRVASVQDMTLDESDAIIQANLVAYALVYASGQSSTAQSSSATNGSGQTYSQSENEQFLQNAPALVVSQAEQMQEPHKTLAQGSVVQAVLQVAINSDLPGNVVAVISEPVPAYSGDRILIPRGSRLFGSYRSGIQTNQKRILIVWSRILTPEGKSLEISSVGGDALGRSGLTGFVDTKFGERFGGAALISMIGAAPSIAAEQVSNDIGSDTLESIGEDLSDATGSVIAEQLALSPTIYIDQGASVTVLVDRDVIIY